MASVPELTIRTFCTEGSTLRIASARSDSRAVGAPKLVPEAIAVRIDRSTCGWAWPRIIGPQEPT